MPRRSVMIAACVLLPMAAAVATEAAAQYPSFPSGYGYMDPSEIEQLNRAVAAGDHSTVRQHGWKLWAGIMQPSGADPGWPFWYAWPNTKAAFAPPPAPLGAVSANANEASTSSAQTGPKKSLILLNAGRAGESGADEIPANVPNVPTYPIPAPVSAAYPNATTICGAGNICDGSHFAFNGDIMIATETLSPAGFDWIRGQNAYQQVTLDEWHNITGQKDLTVPQPYLVTKHMYWPVKKDSITAIPVWHSYHPDDYPNYAGYETWPDLVAVDPTGQSVGKTVQVSYLRAPAPWPTMTASAKVYGLEDFYYHQVTKDDWQSFDENDKAILNASSYWAYGAPFGEGDYLVTIAMHINTREIPTWALQSVFWSDVPDGGSYGLARYAQDRPDLPQAKGPWKHYLLVDAYGIPDKTNPNRLPVATNFYIELVSHPIGTDCNNCHIRAGWPEAKQAGASSYQNPDCRNLLEKFTPGNACFAKYTRTDFQWIIPDRAIAPQQ